MEAYSKEGKYDGIQDAKHKTEIVLDMINVICRRRKPLALNMALNIKATGTMINVVRFKVS